jgi:hypothetical protein
VVAEKKGIVWIASEAGDWPVDRMVEPASSLFWVSWQAWDEAKGRQEHFENDLIVGAEPAIRWGRDRAEVVLIRLGTTYFSAGDRVLSEDPWDGTPLPPWPPAEPPEGWFVMPEAFIQSTLSDWRNPSPEYNITIHLEGDADAVAKDLRNNYQHFLTVHKDEAGDLSISWQVDAPSEEDARSGAARLLDSLPSARVRQIDVQLVTEP